MPVETTFQSGVIADIVLLVQRVGLAYDTACYGRVVSVVPGLLCHYMLSINAVKQTYMATSTHQLQGVVYLRLRNIRKSHNLGERRDGDQEVMSLNPPIGILLVCTMIQPGFAFLSQL